LALSTPAAQDSFLRDLRAAQTTARAGIVSSRATSNDKTWQRWSTFCRNLFVDPWLSDVSDPIILLQVFAQRYRTGEIAPSGRPVRSRTVEGALRAVGQAFTSVGADDPRLTVTGQHEFRLGRQLRGYTREDPPPDRVKPIPVLVIYHATSLAQQHNTVEALAVTHMLCITFFFLCRPGEYTAPNGTNAPFRLADVTFYVGARWVAASSATAHDLNCATFVTLTFTTQKNSVRGEVIGLGLSNNPFVCHVRCTAHCGRHLLEHNAPPNTPLCTYYSDDKANFVTADDISTTLKSSVRMLGTALGFSSTDVSARSLYGLAVQWRFSALMSILTPSV
jgi:hypothetical protein